MTLSEPLHSESHRTSIITPTIALIGWLLIVLGFYFGLKDNDWPSFGSLFTVGALLAGSHWFLAPRRYNIYNDRVVITYGRPRVRIVPFGEVSDIEVKIHALGGEIRVRLNKGGSVSFTPRAPHQFHEVLENALNQYRGIKPDPASQDTTPGEA